MQLGIIGLPSSGKTTVFNAITGTDLPVGQPSGGGRSTVQTAVVDIPDPRVDKLSELLHPSKTTYAKMTFVDLGGLQTREGGATLPGWLINELSPLDGFLHVVRAFEDENVPHVFESVDPARDISAMEAEFILNDLALVERRLERLVEERQKGARDRGEIDREQALFHRILEALNQEQALRLTTFTTEEEHLLSGFGLLSKKPLLLVVNLFEGDREVTIDVDIEGVRIVFFQGRIEMEIGQLPDDEAQIFLDEYGINKPGRERILQDCCALMRRLSFFTFNENELRAWTISEGSTALDAAAIIHTDIARGFIRAEVIGWEELLDLGGLSQARLAGKLRVEGKDYTISDGEMIYIRFNI